MKFNSLMTNLYFFTIVMIRSHPCDGSAMFLIRLVIGSWVIDNLMSALKLRLIIELFEMFT